MRRGCAVSRCNIGVYLLQTILVLALCIVWTSQDPTGAGAGYAITPTVDTAITFEEVYQFKLVNDHWVLLTSIPVGNLFKQLELARTYFAVYFNLVQGDNPDEVIRIQLVNAETDLKEIERSLSTVRALFDKDEVEETEGNRRKRALFRSVGGAIRFLTGNLDEDDAQYYDEKIKQMGQGAHDIYELTRQQTSVINTVIHALNGTINDWEATRKQAETAFSQIAAMNAELTARTENNTNQIKALRVITESYSVLENLIVSTRHNTELVLKAYEDVKDGRLSPLIVSPDLLRTTLLKINLPAGLNLPVDLNTDTISAYYKLIEVSSFVSNFSLNLVLRVPLTNSEQFTMYSVIALPFHPTNGSGDVYMIIKPEAPYLGISNSDLHYAPYTYEEAKACRSLGNRKKICPVSGIIKDVHTQTDTCLMSFYKNKKTLEPECDARILVARRPVWARTRSPCQHMDLCNFRC